MIVRRRCPRRRFVLSSPSVLPHGVPQMLFQLHEQLPVARAEVDAFFNIAPGFELLVFVGFFAGNEGLGHPASAFWLDAHGGEGLNSGALLGLSGLTD